MILQDLVDKGLVKPPTWLPLNCLYLTITGSVAYGVSSDTSDMDLIGFAIPRKELIFPHLAGFIPEFGKQPNKDDGTMFPQWQQHGIVDEHAMGGKGRVYDFAVFNIVKYFDLLMVNNPNIIDSVFTAQECVLHLTEVGNMVRENRTMFLHKGCYPRFKGYAYKQTHKMATKKPKGKRKEIRDKYGYDCKFGYNIVRLLGECEQILMNCDLDLRLNHEHLKAIRRGEVSEADVKKWASDKEKQLEKLFVESKLPEKPDEEKIKKLLLECLEHHYGNLEKCIVLPDKYKQTLEDIKLLINKAGL